MRSRTFLLTSVAALSPGFYIYWNSKRLAEKYPSLPPSGASSVLLKSDNPSTQYVPSSSADVFCARIPRSALQSVSERVKGGSLHEVWAKAFLTAPIISLEGRIIGFFAGKNDGPGDTGVDTGFKPGQELLNGAFTVLHSPTPSTPLLVSWKNPPHLVTFFGKIAALGYPWRLMTGGRHSFEVKDAGGEEVEVTFGCAHDYERANSVSGKEDGKVIPEWVGWAHRTFGRWILDDVVRELLKRDK